MTDDDPIGLAKRLERVQADRWNIDETFRRRASDLLDTPAHHRTGLWPVKAEELLAEINRNRRAVTDMRRRDAAEEENRASRIQAENRRKLDDLLRGMGDPL